MDATEAEREAIVRFFKKIIREYNCGDIKWLLKKRTPTLGPLLACVGAGVDTIGGMMFGFKTGNSKDRSMQFLKDVMKFDGTTAGGLYRCARCGYVHEGIGKLNFSWFADYERIMPGYVLFRRPDGGLALNVVELCTSTSMAFTMFGRIAEENFAIYRLHRRGMNPWLRPCRRSRCPAWTLSWVSTTTGSKKFAAVTPSTTY